MARFKLLPAPPDDVDAVRVAWRAVPLVPVPEAEAVARLERRLGLPSRDVARTWLTFLRALDLVDETGSGVRRLRGDTGVGTLRERFLARVFLAEEALAAVAAADGPVDADAAFDRVRDRVPEWERHKNPRTWADVWRERVGDLLGWLTVLGAVERVEGGYVAVG
jgi:hypothetical protein